MKHALLILAAATVVLLSGCGTTPVHVTRVTSGVTFEAMDDGILVHFRIVHLTVGKADDAHAFLDDLIHDRDVNVRTGWPRLTDRQGCVPAHVFIGKRNVAGALVHHGVASHTNDFWNTAPSTVDHGSDDPVDGTALTALIAIIRAPTLLPLLIF